MSDNPWTIIRELQEAKEDTAPSYRCPKCGGRAYLLFSHYTCERCKAVFTYDGLHPRRDTEED